MNNQSDQTRVRNSNSTWEFEVIHSINKLKMEMINRQEKLDRLARRLFDLIEQQNQIQKEIAEVVQEINSITPFEEK